MQKVVKCPKCDHHFGVQLPEQQQPARRCGRCGGSGMIDSGYNGWFAPPDTTCDACNGTGVVY